MTLVRYSPLSEYAFGASDPLAKGAAFARSPWSLANRLHQSLDQIFGETLSSPEASSSPSVTWVPRVDIHEEKDRFVVLADVPGVESKDIDITAEKGVLTIRGERRSEKKDTENGYERVERVAGTFLRRFTLPESANTESITAKQTNGVLEVTIPKQPQVQPRRIAIDASR